VRPLEVAAQLWQDGQGKQRHDLKSATGWVGTMT
jgi:hypothetical protein